ncbi:hypothetical protein [Alkalihalobacterium alkalinitrilicum]|uniref:hypothetical protein n=1 Tax=Alkalihalobacterium alkalinitrilicum TaxID=427920 RepID=UPI000995B712|nr:hypothetical protein [Alkalihalobacterium alkalinitrilicum]
MIQQQQPQQTSMNQQQGIMPQPPNVVTSKDHLYISDMLSWNLLAMKKCHFYAGHCTDPEVKAVIEKAGQMHKQHYDRVLQHFQTQNQTNFQALQ